MNSNEIISHLAVLGVSPNAENTPDALKKAWRQKCIEHHPDKGGDAKDFQAVCHSYKMLTDPSYRENHKEPPRRILDMQIIVPIRFEDAFFGAHIPVTWNRIEFDAEMQVKVKPHLETAGFGARVAAGSMGDITVKVPGLGAYQGERSGDAILVFRAVPHKRFRVDHEDVVTEEALPLDVMLKGGEIEVQTMWGLRTVKVPAGTQPGSALRIPKAGVRKQGDHQIVCQPIFPTEEDLKEKEAWQSLDIDWEASEAAEDEQSQQDEQFEQTFQSMGGFTFTVGPGGFR